MKFISTTLEKLHCIPLYGTAIESEVLLISMLHHSGKIPYEKMLGMFRALRAGTLMKTRTHYRCTIDKRWYQNEPPFEIFLEILGYCELDVKKFLEYYVRLYLNKHPVHSYWFVRSLLLDLFQAYSSESIVGILRRMNFQPANEIKTYYESEESDELSWGYCCSDCDGCLSSYREHKYDYLYGSKIKELPSQIEEYLTSLYGRELPKMLLNRTCLGAQP
jgi:hypothetical protein